MLCGRPKDDGWDGVNDRFANALFEARGRVSGEGCQRRGCFINASAGVTLGPGASVSLCSAQVRCILTGACFPSTLETCATPRRRK